MGAAARPKPIVSFLQPSTKQLIGNGRARLVIATRNGARPTRVDVDGVNVTSALRAGANGTYTATVSLGHGLHYGYNDAFVHGKNKAFDHTRFVVAKRDDSLLKDTDFRTGVSDTPVRATLRLPKGAGARAYVNGHRVARAFSEEGRDLVARLGANDGIHHGRNRIRILVEKTHAYKRQSTFDVESHTVTVCGCVPIAGADNLTITQNSFAQLNGGASRLPSDSAQRSFSWKIVRAPKGSKAKLRAGSSASPGLVPDVAGHYRVRVSVRGNGLRARRGLAAGLEAAAAAKAQTAASRDTATLTVMPDVPPIGLRLDAMTRNRSITLNGQQVAGGLSLGHNINYVVLDRTTLQPAEGGIVAADFRGIRQLSDIVDKRTGSQNYIVVLNWLEFQDNLDAARNELDRLLQKIGGQRLTDSQRQRISADQFPGSAIGVPGAPAGSAYVTFSYRTIPASECPNVDVSCDAWPTVGGTSGALRLNGVIGKYDFVFTDYVDFDTEVNQTQSQISPAQLTIRVGNKTYTQPNPGTGESGFHLLRLNAKTLDVLAESTYPTNAPNGAQQQFHVARLNNDLQQAANQPERPLVILQAYGAPHAGTAEFDQAVWDQAAQQIERLGGTRQVFNAMNAGDPRPENGEDANRKGPYAFVGRVNASAPRAEQSYSLNGLPGRLSGELMRARDGGFEPMIAAPARPDAQPTANNELIGIANQTPQGFPPFPDADGHLIKPGSAQEQAVLKFLGGPEVAKLCSKEVLACDIRKLYYLSYNNDTTSWTSVQEKLGGDAKDKCKETHTGFTPTQCEGIRAELHDEVANVVAVKGYFDGLKRVYGTASVAALANINAISTEIFNDVRPPPANNTTSKVLTGISYFLKLGLFAPPPASNVAAGTAAVFGLAGYFSHSDGSPNLIGPQVTGAASKLGVELVARYQQAGNNLDEVGKLIVSDYRKLSIVADKVNAVPGPGEVDWRLQDFGKTAAAVETSARQNIYERLVPIAYPVIYDLGESGNARGWYCDGGSTFDKHLFNEQADGAQLVGRFGDWHPNMAVGQANAVGSLHSARIPGLPGSIADPPPQGGLFTSTDNGGVGLTKLEFFSPRNGFRYFPAEPTRSPAYDSGSGTYNSLNQFPQGRPGVLRCSAVPNPPGNSG